LLVEVHDESEMEARRQAGSAPDRHQNRNLKTFVTDLNVTQKNWRQKRPETRIWWPKAGSRARRSQTLAQVHVTTVLIGESLMRRRMSKRRTAAVRRRLSQ